MILHLFWKHIISSSHSFFSSWKLKYILLIRWSMYCKLLWLDSAVIPLKYTPQITSFSNVSAHYLAHFVSFDVLN
jgi:hypothetical protein